MDFIVSTKTISTFISFNIKLDWFISVIITKVIFSHSEIKKYKTISNTMD